MTTRTDLLRDELANLIAAFTFTGSRNDPYRLADAIFAVQPQYPHRVGDVYAIGPEIISTTEKPELGTVINWAGENFTVQPAPDAA